MVTEGGSCHHIIFRGDLGLEIYQIITHRASSVHLISDSVSITGMWRAPYGDVFGLEARGLDAERDTEVLGFGLKPGQSPRM
jgi:hypothetical protein